MVKRKYSASMEEKIKTLIENYGANDQRTEAWHTKRGEMLTASEIYKALADATPAMKHEIMMSKLTPRPKTEGLGPRALLWGTRFEPIAKEIYCRNQGSIEIVDTTCIPHPVHSFLGASPDGIIVTPDPEDFRYGKLVEFKCPISREFSNDTPVPPAYLHQMQLQMECTELDECEYIEMGFKEVSYSEWMDSKAEFKSFYAIHVDTGAVKYRDLNDNRDVATWRREQLGDDGGNWDLLYWYLKSWRCLTVPKDLTWLSTNLSSMETLWKEVQEHRANGTFPEHPKAKTTLAITF
jgi:putative phage-type endonuclease